MIGQFPRKASAFRQGPALPDCGFVRWPALPHHRVRAKGPVPDARFCLDCYPSRLGQRPPALPVFGCGFPRRRAHSCKSPFRMDRFGLFWSPIESFEKGSIPCSNPFSLSVFSALPVCPPARPRGHRSTPTVLHSAWRVAQHWARQPTPTSRSLPSPAACSGRLRATRALAGNRLTPAPSGAASGEIKAIGAAAPMAFCMAKTGSAV